jgi:nitrogen fixation/metabolism regulation signal transduction histidine kinase
VFFVAILLIVLAYVLLYSPRFALDITDPVHVMKRGMEESGYNLEVKIPSQRAGEDVFELAGLYNRIFLPMKDRASAQEDQGSALAIDDIRSFVEKQ